MTRASLLGVLYAEDFDEEGAVPEATDPAAEPESIEPTFTLAELEVARAEARAAGRLEAEHGLAAARNHMLGLLASGVADSRAAAAAVTEAAAEGVVRCLLGALLACLPDLCQRHGAGEVRALVRFVLPALRDEPRITVRVNPQMLAAMQAEVAAMDFEIAERVRLLPTDAVAPGDARIDWTDGSAVRDAARARAAMQDALAALGLLEQEMADA